MKNKLTPPPHGRVTLLLPRDVLEALDSSVACGAGRNRSALAAELLRCALQHRAGHRENGPALGVVSIRYDAKNPAVAEGLLAAENSTPCRVCGVTETAIGDTERLRVAIVRGNLPDLSAFAAACETVRNVLRVQLTISKVWEATR